jgi:hypothetical protein
MKDRKINDALYDGCRIRRVIAVADDGLGVLKSTRYARDIDLEGRGRDWQKVGVYKRFLFVWVFIPLTGEHEAAEPTQGSDL